MRYIPQLLFISFILCFSSAFAETDLPSTNSKPLPTLSTVKNPDTVLTEKVQAKIKKTKILDNQPVSAASQEGVITLQGSVENKAQEDAAINAAKSVQGVKEVKSQLTIGHHTSENTQQ